MKPAEILKERLVEAGVSALTVDRLTLANIDCTRVGPKMSIEAAASAAIASRRMPRDTARAFATILSGGTGPQHAQAVARAYRLARAAPDLDALERDLIAIHAVGGEAGEAVRMRIAGGLAGAVRRLAHRDVE